MIFSKQTSAHVTTVHKVDLTKVAKLRDKIKGGFQERYGFGLTYLSFVTRAAAPLLKRSGNGAVVNLASIAGLHPAAQVIPYAASKAAIVNMTMSFARILAPEVRVNAVAPGWMEGRWMQSALGADYDRLMERRGKRTPLRRVATPDDVAQTIVSLVAENDFVTGQVVVIDGGYSIVA